MAKLPFAVRASIVPVRHGDGAQRCRIKAKIPPVLTQFVVELPQKYQNTGTFVITAKTDPLQNCAHVFGDEPHTRPLRNKRETFFCNEMRVLKGSKLSRMPAGVLRLLWLAKPLSSLSQQAAEPQLRKV